MVIRNDNEVESENSTETSKEQNDAGSTANGVEDMKYSLPTVQMDSGDEMAINSLFDESSGNESFELNESSGPNGLVLGENETAEKKGDTYEITRILGNGLAMIYTYGEKLNALQPLYQIKVNDIISENIPFKENVGTNDLKSL